jgi:hypothetical protein
VTVAALERLHDDAGVRRRDGLNINDARLQESFTLHECLPSIGDPPVHGGPDYFE